MSAEHSSTYLKEWWSGLNEAQASDLKAKYNSSSWVSDPNGGNLPEKLKKFHLEKLFQLAHPLQNPFQLQAPSPKPQAPIPEKKEIALEDMDIPQLLEFIKTQRDLMGQVDAKEAEVRKNLSKFKAEMLTYLEIF